MNEVTLHIKIGELEVSYAGSEPFARDQLVPLMQGLLALDLPDIAPKTEPSPPQVSAGAQHAQLPTSDSRKKLSTTDFAAKMGAKSGSDLVMAAAASLHHSQNQDEFRRADLLNEMKAAKAFYRASYGSNLSKSLDMLVKSGRLQNPRTETYALPYSEIENTGRYL